MKTIVRIIDWKNSVVYVEYSDGSKGYDHPKNASESVRSAYRHENRFRS